MRLLPYRTVVKVLAIGFEVRMFRVFGRVVVRQVSNASRGARHSHLTGFYRGAGRIYDRHRHELRSEMPAASLAAAALHHSAIGAGSSLAGHGDRSDALALLIIDRHRAHIIGGHGIEGTKSISNHLMCLRIRGRNH